MVISLRVFLLSLRTHMAVLRNWQSTKTELQIRCGFWGDSEIINKVCQGDIVFSSPGRSPGRAIVLPPALASASALAKC